MEFEIGKEDSKKSVKQFLYNTLRLSHGQVTALKRQEQGILLNGERVFVTVLLQEGDRLSLLLEDREEHKPLAPFACPLEILYEDETLLCVNKPPFMPTHPSLNHYDDTLANALAEYFRLKNRPFVFRGINRLDRDTSGVILVAKNRYAASLLSKQVAERQMDKQYLALLEGTLEQDRGFIDRNIVRAEESLMLRRVAQDSEGSCALTEYRVCMRKNGKTLVIAIPHTGRTHQLRVHFSFLGHPIVGDTLYGAFSEEIDRQALHAYSLGFTHPVSGEKMKIKAPLPKDMEQLLMKNGFVWEREEL